MINRLFSDTIAKTLESVQIAEEEPQVTAQTPQSQSTETTHMAQQQQLATAAKGDSMFAGAMQRQMLSAQLPAQVPVGSTTSVGSTNEVLGPDMSGPQVSNLQSQLNMWRAENNLPPIAENGVYNPETTDAVKQFQEANGLAKDGFAGPNTKDRLKLENNPKFQQMNSNVKQYIRETFNEYQNNPTARENLMKLVDYREFNSFLSGSSQIEMVGVLRQNPADPTHFSNTIGTSRDLAAMEQDPTYKNLSAETRYEAREAMLEHADYSEGREAIGRLTTSSSYEQLTQTQQMSLLKAVRQNPGDVTAPELVHILNSNSFGKMNPQMQDRVITLACNNANNPSVLKSFSETMNDISFYLQDDDGKWSTLSGFDLKPIDPDNIPIT